MGSSELFMHYVCTIEEARELCRGEKVFSVSNCGCREEKGYCSQSRMDVCLMFDDSEGSSGSNKHRITEAEVEGIFREAIAKKLVTRPFRNEDFTKTSGICFCCNDCCWYFVSRSEECNKGKYIEVTDWDACIHCGICTKVCYFKARTMNGSELQVDRNECYGCGLCVKECPVQCISMQINDVNI